MDNNQLTNTEANNQEVLQRASDWIEHRHPEFENLRLGKVSKMKSATYDKKLGRPVGLPDSFVVPIECNSCGNVVARYVEHP